MGLMLNAKSLFLLIKCWIFIADLTGARGVNKAYKIAWLITFSYNKIFLSLIPFMKAFSSNRRGQQVPVG
jgi:hypothetical protein